MATSSSSTSKLTMKLLIDTNNKRVLFAEASKPVIDFLFNLLRLPIGTVVRLLNKNGMVGSLGNLYGSVENLSEGYMIPNLDKDVVLKPKTPISRIFAAVLGNDEAGAGDTKGSSLFMCYSRCKYKVTCDNTTPCPHCNQIMNHAVRYVGNKVGVDDQETSIKNGFVNEMVTFMVMDDLVVQPMSISRINALLNKFNVKDLGALQEKVVHLDMAEGVDLLKASMQSEMVLTSVFMKKIMINKAEPKKKRRRRL